MKVSINDILVKALALAHEKSNPAYKCILALDDMIFINYNSIDVSIAVALDEGLITPILKMLMTKGIKVKYLKKSEIYLAKKLKMEVY